MQASRIGRYPVHLQRLPSKAFSICVAEQLSPLLWAMDRAVWQATTIPGVQKPHCEPWKPAIRSAHIVKCLSDIETLPGSTFCYVQTVELVGCACITVAEVQQKHRAKGDQPCTALNPIWALPKPSTVTTEQPSRLPTGHKQAFIHLVLS